MIPELTRFALLCIVVIIGAACLAESGKLEDMREKRMINRLADRSRKHKPMASRQSRWAGMKI